MEPGSPPSTLREDHTERTHAGGARGGRASPRSLWGRNNFTITTPPEQLKEVQIYNLKHSLQMWVGFLHQKQPVQGARARAQGEPERRGASACVSGCAGRGGLSKMRGRDVHTDDVV